MRTREIARRIVELRRLLIAGAYAELMGDTAEHARLQAEFTTLALTLPLSVRATASERLLKPAARHTMRRGVLTPEKRKGGRLRRPE